MGSLFAFISGQFTLHCLNMRTYKPVNCVTLFGWRVTLYGSHIFNFGCILLERSIFETIHQIHGKQSLQNGGKRSAERNRAALHCS